MARGINKVILVGNVGVDPEVRYLQNGDAVTSLSVATTDSWKDKQTGEKQERTEWHRVSCFKRLAEIAGEYIRKGSKIYVEGSLRTRKWQDQQGQDRYTTEIIATDIQMLDTKGASSGGYDASRFDDAQSSPPAMQARQPQRMQSAPASKPAPDGFEELNDDIPF